MSDELAPTPDPQQRDVMAALAAPFDPRELKLKPQVVKGNRGLAAVYVDARVVQERLDEVLGVEGWQDEYTILPDGGVVCSLSLKLGAKWVRKMDVGSPSEQPDGGDRLKAAFSDALKRAAVKFGVGRYLYRLPAQWLDYDPVKKQFTQTPTLPQWAVAGASGPAAVGPGGQQPAALPAAQQTRQGQQQPARQADPPKPFESHEDAVRRVQALDADLAGRSLSRPGDLTNYLAAAVYGAGFDKDRDRDNPDMLAFAYEVVKRFRNMVGAKKRPAPAKQVADQMAEQLQAKLDTAGKARFRDRSGEWLAEQGVPDPAALNKYDYAALARLLADLNTQIEQEKQERQGIEGGY